MLHLKRQDFDDLDHVYRINMMNSCSGFKSANLIGTKSNDGTPNVAVFSSVTHLGSNPPFWELYLDLYLMCQEILTRISKKQDSLP